MHFNHGRKRGITYPFLYVLSLKDGGIKFGCTDHPKQRIAFWNTQSSGVEWAHIFGRVKRVSGVCQAERACLEIARNAGWNPRPNGDMKSGKSHLIARETFDGGDFKKAINIGRAARDKYREADPILKKGAPRQMAKVEFFPSIPVLEQAVAA